MKVLIIFLICTTIYGQDPDFTPPNLDINLGELILTDFLNQCHEYEKECYADSSKRIGYIVACETNSIIDGKFESQAWSFFSETYYGNEYVNCRTVRDTTYYIHSKPTFPGFIRFLEKKLQHQTYLK